MVDAAMSSRDELEAELKRLRAENERLKKKADSELSQDFLTLLAHTSDFIYFKDKDSRIRFCSQAMATLCGHADWRDMRGKHDLEIFPEETARIYYEEELPVFRDGKPLLNKIDPYIDVNGDKRWVSTCKWPVFGDDGKTVVGIFGISRDVTGRMTAAEEARRQALRSEALLRSASDGIHVLDAKGNVLEANDVFCKMLGYTHDEALKLNVVQWDARWSEQELRNEVLPRLIAHPEVFETKHRRRDGESIEVEVSAVGIDLDGEPVLFAASRDITERKRTEENMRRLAAELAEVYRLKDVFTDVLRHDMLNPANAISLQTDLLLRSGVSASQADLLQGIKRNVRNMTEIAANAAQYARLTATKTVPFADMDLQGLLRSTCDEFAVMLEQKDIRLNLVALRPALAPLSPLIKNVFANLLSNAIKYGPAHSTIEVGLTEEAETWLVAVKDSGGGIPDHGKKLVFNRFERLNKEAVQGSGLGLAIAKQIVTLHRGTIWVEDGPAGGAVFFVRLPKSQVQKEE